MTGRCCRHVGCRKKVSNANRLRAGPQIVNSWETNSCANTKVSKKNSAGSKPADPSVSCFRFAASKNRTSARTTMFSPMRSFAAENKTPGEPSTNRSWNKAKDTGGAMNACRHRSSPVCYPMDEERCARSAVRVLRCALDDSPEPNAVQQRAGSVGKRCVPQLDAQRLPVRDSRCEQDCSPRGAARCEVLRLRLRHCGRTPVSVRSEARDSLPKAENRDASRATGFRCPGASYLARLW